MLKTTALSHDDVVSAIMICQTKDVAPLTKQLNYVIEKLQEENLSLDLINQHPVVRLLSISIVYISYQLDEKFQLECPSIIDDQAHALRDAIALAQSLNLNS